MNSRERVLASLNFQEVDRVPKDLGGMNSCGISAFAYPKLVKALGLPYRKPKIYDSSQMLALPDMDVLDALGCDIVTISDGGITNAFDQVEQWKPFDFGGRLDALVINPDSFEVQDDGTIIQYKNSQMVPMSYVFDALHGGQPIDWSGEMPKFDLDELRQEKEKALYTKEQLIEIKAFCKKAKESTDKAVFFNGRLNANIGIAYKYGIGIFPMMCVLEPEHVKEIHEIEIEYMVKNVSLLLEEIHPYVDIIRISADDWGTQQNLIASPETYRDLFKSFYKRVNDTCHTIAPNVKTFLHSCGAVYPLIDDFIESGFDILNPVQWPAGDKTFQEWKDLGNKRISFWGGGVNAQHTLPLGSIDEVENEVREVVDYFSQDSGYVFNSIHNLLAEVQPEKIIAMYKTASTIAV